MKNKVTDIGAAVLAGGKNSRMPGLNKAFIKIEGATIIQRTVKLLGKVFDEIILVTNCPKDFRLYEDKVVITEDIIKNAGPLGGIHSALCATQKEAVFFVACDMPFLHNAVIRRQLDFFDEINCDCLVARVGSSIEPLHAIYKKGLKDSIGAFLKISSDRSIRAFLSTVNLRYFDLGNKNFYRDIFINVNTPQDLKKTGGRYAGKI